MTVKTSDAALANAAGQGINIALGNQRNFSWSSVAGAAVEAGVSDELQDPNSIDAGNLVNSTTGGNLAYSSAVGLISGATAQGAQVLLSGHGQIQFASIAANSFGQALGSSLVGQLQSTPGETQASAVATTTAIAPLGGDAGQPFAALPQIPSYADTSAEAVPTPDQSEAQPQGTIALGVALGQPTSPNSNIGVVGIASKPEGAEATVEDPIGRIIENLGLGNELTEQGLDFSAKATGLYLAKQATPEILADVQKATEAEEILTALPGSASLKIISTALKGTGIVSVLAGSAEVINDVYHAPEDQKFAAVAADVGNTAVETGVVTGTAALVPYLAAGVIAGAETGDLATGGVTPLSPLGTAIGALVGGVGAAAAYAGFDLSTPVKRAFTEIYNAPHDDGTEYIFGGGN